MKRSELISARMSVHAKVALVALLELGNGDHRMEDVAEAGGLRQKDAIKGTRHLRNYAERLGVVIVGDHNGVHFESKVVPPISEADLLAMKERLQKAEAKPAVVVKKAKKKAVRK